ncbi:hypothetical protein [Priestia sp. SB1]|uniref:hypothetical protein n=1 Tax=Priestia sp. SB1 TaxID=3132359 RepID=UPI00319E2CDD
MCYEYFGIRRGRQGAYWLTSPSGEEIEGTTVTTIIRSFSISYQGNLYIVEITIED